MMSDTTKGNISARFARVLRLGQNNDPLSSLQAVSRWTDKLAVGDPLKAHTDILNEVKRFNENGTASSKDSLMILMTLDDKAQDLQSALSRQYLRNPRMSRGVESDLWHAIYQLNWEILRGYHAHVFSYFREQGGAKLKAMIPLATLRAIRGFRQVIKWRCLRYMHPGEKTWARLHQLYHIAESQGYHRTKLLAYPDEDRETTCEWEYLHILMLYQANSGSLYPRQIDLIDRWLDSWKDMLELEQELDPDRHVFLTDLTQDFGARRVRGQSTTEPSTRFWSTLKLLTRIKGIQAEIHTGVAPARLGLSEQVRVAESLELLSHLASEWGVLTSREQRRKPRVAVKKMVEIVHGFPAIFQHVKHVLAEQQFADKQDAMLPDNPVADAGSVADDSVIDLNLPGWEEGTASPNFRGIERWVMEDESEDGYGTKIQNRDKDWLLVGALVGLRTDRESLWSVGVVRRLSRLSEMESSVGIEILRGKPMDVMLVAMEDGKQYFVEGEAMKADRPTVNALLINEGDAPRLLMVPAAYQRHAVLRYASGTENKVIRLGDIIEHDHNWLQCSITWL